MFVSAEKTSLIGITSMNAYLKKFTLQLYNKWLCPWIMSEFPQANKKKVKRLCIMRKKSVFFRYISCDVE